ncbi:hypothetical protein FBY35_0235 [Streptomyces sp. SLBN-118]|nr:hypothetical protein FBY35_0235 [Streptomyces sp. SLBN-118]
MVAGNGDIDEADHPELTTLADASEMLVARTVWRGSG